MKNKIISAIISFAFMFCMLFAGVPAFAVIVLQAILLVGKDLFFHIFCEPKEVNQIITVEGIAMLAAFVVCLLTGFVYWGF